MKLRQKLAVVLAATMIATAMPVVTMAQADIKVVSGIKIADEDAPVSNSLRIEMKDATDQAFDFFVFLENAEFSDAAGARDPKAIKDTAGADLFGGVTQTYTQVTGDKEMRVRVTPTAGATENFIIPLDNVVLKGGDATVSIDGAGSVISDLQPVVFARTSDAEAKVTVADAENIYTDTGAVAKITIDEPYQGVIKNTNTIDFTVRHADYEIKKATVTYERGFSGTAQKVYTADVAGEAKFEDGNTIFKLTPPANYNGSNAAGRITVVFELDTTEKDPSTGALEVKVDGEDVVGTTVKVAEIKKYGTELEMKDKKVEEVKAGHSEEITFKIKEVIADAFSGNREFDLTFENAFLAPYEDGKTYSDKASATPAVGFDTTGKFDADRYVQNKFTASDLDNLVVKGAITDSDDRIIGMTLEIPTAEIKTTDEDDFELKDIEVFAALGTTGDVTIKANGRALADEAKVVAMNIKPSVDVTIEPMTIKVGLKEQKGGKIAIKEADKGVLEQGKWIYIKLDDSDSDGLKLKDTDLDKIIKVTEGDLVLDLDSADVVSSNKVLKVKVKRESTVASTISIADLTVYADRTVPQGSYNIKIGGTAIANAWSVSDVDTIKSLEAKDFIIVGTPNTEDIGTNGLKKGTASFVVGSAKYVVNGVEATTDGAAYIANGRTMVPVRYVANALGVDGKDIYFAGKTVTVIAGSKTVSLEVGNKTAKLNGVAARVMAAAPVMKDGRVYVPVAEIGALLGVEATWDAATQTATFTNK